MTKGTTSFGERHNKSHTTCRRCGKVSFHIQKKRCSSCAYPNPKRRSFNWSKKAQGRRTTGTGRMRYMKSMTRRFKNGFRDTSPFCFGPFLGSLLFESPLIHVLSRAPGVCVLQVSLILTLLLTGTLVTTSRALLVVSPPGPVTLTTLLHITAATLTPTGMPMTDFFNCALQCPYCKH